MNLAVLGFGVLMLGAMSLYPGGHLWDRSRPGYDFWRNFWCDLLRERAYNGELNQVAPPLARAAMLLLSLGILGYFVLAPSLFAAERRLRITVSVMGTLGALGLSLVTWVSSGRLPVLHGIAVLAAGPVGLCALVGTLVGFWRSPSIAKPYAVWGLLALVVSLSSLVQYFRELVFHVASSQFLPVSQKLGTLLALSWMCAVSARVFARRCAQGTE